MTVTEHTDRRVTLPIAAVVVLAGTLANGIVDLIASAELSQFRSYLEGGQSAFMEIYFPYLRHCFRWVIPICGFLLLIALRARTFRFHHYVWSLCAFALLAILSVTAGILVIYPMYALRHHVVGG
ncbi:MAG: hypothetical protein ACI9OD_003935 [Limisphaerales bacterium]|jgi:hypothetical protein